MSTRDRRPDGPIDGPSDRHPKRDASRADALRDRVEDGSGDVPEAVMTVPRCARCDVLMELGFVPYVGVQNKAKELAFIPGIFSPSFWSGGLRREQAKTARTLVAFRCPSCSIVEFYAPGPPGGGKDR